jgi:hypothetical protein
MDEIQEQLEAVTSPFLSRIDRELEKSRELRQNLNDLLRDVRRINARLQPRNYDAMPSGM